MRILFHSEDGTAGESSKANGLRWLNQVVRVFTGASKDRSQIGSSHGFGMVSHEKGEIRLGGGQSFSRFLTDTVSFHH